MSQWITCIDGPLKGQKVLVENPANNDIIEVKMVKSKNKKEVKRYRVEDDGWNFKLKWEGGK